MNEKIDYRTHEPQTLKGWGGVETFIYAGKCVVCGRNVYARSNGSAPDPRGFVNELHAYVPIVAHEYGLPEGLPTLAACFACMNTRATYERAIKTAQAVWSTQA